MPDNELLMYRISNPAAPPILSAFEAILRRVTSPPPIRGRHD
jgi:hypothetical protein